MPVFAAPDSAAAVARRGVAALVASGLVVAVAATAASADPPRKVDTGTPPKAAIAAMITPTVKVPAEVTWSVATIDAVATPPPPPDPAPAPAVARNAPSASRAGDRTALRTATRAAPAGGAAAAPAAAAPAPAPAPAPPPSASASAVVNVARQYLGTPYVHGGTGPGGFDCSGFTQYVFAQVGVSLPRSSSQQRYAGTVVSAAEARPGDLVWGPGHVGIYTGGGHHIAARNPGTPLSEGPIYMANPVFIRVM
ncbi:C40 family peptidase [Georgenia ruanii]|uniref:C40 family peptidase n=1 Tax=Georgenia ruanii TaxID=348442 RepID=UPI00126422D5|nr:C40 family peptidase [Georgenia ruanii]